MSVGKNSISGEKNEYFHNKTYDIKFFGQPLFVNYFNS